PLVDNKSHAMEGPGGPVDDKTEGPLELRPAGASVRRGIVPRKPFPGVKKRAFSPCNMCAIRRSRTTPEADALARPLLASGEGIHRSRTREPTHGTRFLERQHQLRSGGDPRHPPAGDRVARLELFPARPQG